MLADKPPRFSRLHILVYIVAGVVLYLTPFTLEKLDAALWNTAGFPSSTGDAAEVGLQQQFSWDQVPPSYKLNWKDCYPGRQCARLIVPLNHYEPEGDIAVIALVRKPADTPPDSEDYRGPVLLNPGGPGESGVDMVVARGDAFSGILGPQFDIVGFDPRGVGRSTPRAIFFDTDAERSLWAGSDRRVQNTSAQVTERWARAKVEGQLAKEHDETGYLRHINTDQTARDMLHIVRAHGKEKLQYWGFSYGSILGATFASIFPDNVGRVIIDGVVDAENYFATLWSNNLMDTDKSLQSFFDSCSNAGPERCPFYAPTPGDVARNLTKILNSIHKAPMPVRTESSYGLLDYNKLKSAIFNSLYNPYAAFPRLAQGLADLVAGNATALYKMEEEPVFQCACGISPDKILDIDEGGAAIRCNDGKSISGSLESTVDHYNMMTKESQWGENWVVTRIACTAWPDFPKTHFQGPFLGNTSHPVLLIGNTADPVTPLWAAKKMSRGFKDSVVLTQDSPGHCSIAAPSVCTQKYIREYFLNGTLPKAGTVCPVDEEIFSSARSSIYESSQARLTEGLSELDNGILQSIRSISLSYSIPAGPLAVPW
ncbi:TAP-like protein-domain-containing protein [Cyathus striatus]|nr:TAP-like protein-domain-containing protein [Cyathus striatus]